MLEMGNATATKGSRPARRKAAASLPAIPTSLADALFTTTQQRVLALLFGQPGRSFFATELIELTGSGSSAVQRELKRLTSSGLVTVRRIGSQKHYLQVPTPPSSRSSATSCLRLWRWWNRFDRRSSHWRTALSRPYCTARS